MTLGGFTNGLAGFAFSAMAGGLMFMIVEPPVAVALMSLSTVCLHICNNIHFFKKINWKQMLWYIVPGLAGIPLGNYLLLELSRLVIGAIFGLTLVLYAVWMMTKKPHAENNMGGRVGEVIVGFIGGIFAGMLSMPGTPAVIWCNLRGYGKEKQRGFTVPFNLTMLIGTSAMLGLKGGYTAPQTLDLMVAALPCIFIGWFVGIRSFGKLSESTFRKFVLFVFFVSGIALLLPAAKKLAHFDTTPAAVTAPAASHAKSTAAK